jgi:hypothetical protein
VHKTEQVLHKVLHIYPPERPKTSFYAPESPIIINNMRKTEPFRNRQVTGSIPVVGSIKFREVNKMPALQRRAFFSLCRKLCRCYHITF